jgi:hypothetical protein
MSFAKGKCEGRRHLVGAWAAVDRPPTFVCYSTVSVDATSVSTEDPTVTS